MSTIIETDKVKGQYDMWCHRMIVSHNGQRVLLIQGWGGMGDIRGGTYRWTHGEAVQLLPTDTLLSLSGDSDIDGTSIMDLALRGYDDTRPILGWTGAAINSYALHAIAKAEGGV